MRRRGLITLGAVLPVWVILYFGAKSVEFKEEGWMTFISPQMEHIKTGLFVAALTTLLGIAFLITDFIRWLLKKLKANG
jgi:uncharacterized membrane protein